MSYKITFTERFQKHYKVLTKDERKRISQKLKLLAENPQHPSLRAKRIQGTDNLFEASMNMDIRIIWFYEGANLIILLDVGHHDILNKY